MYSVGKEVCVVHGFCGGIRIMLGGSVIFMEWHIHRVQIEKDGLLVWRVTGSSVE